jgi:cell division protein ZapA
MKNKILVQICDKEYTLITEEPEDYVKKIAGEITEMIDATAYKNLRTSKFDAAMITCLDLCDKMRKLSEDNDNMRREIIGYIDEIGKLSKKLSAFERQKSGRKQTAQESADEPENDAADYIKDDTENTEDSKVL